MTCKSGVNWTVNNVRLCRTCARSPTFHASSDILRATKCPDAYGPQEPPAYVTYRSLCTFLVYLKAFKIHRQVSNFPPCRIVFPPKSIRGKLTELWGIYRSLEWSNQCATSSSAVNTCTWGQNRDGATWWFPEVKDSKYGVKRFVVQQRNIDVLWQEDGNAAIHPGSHLDAFQATIWLCVLAQGNSLVCE